MLFWAVGGAGILKLITTRVQNKCTPMFIEFSNFPGAAVFLRA